MEQGNASAILSGYEFNGNLKEILRIAIKLAMLYWLQCWPLSI